MSSSNSNSDRFSVLFPWKLPCTVCNITPLQGLSPCWLVKCAATAVSVLCEKTTGTTHSVCSSHFSISAKATNARRREGEDDLVFATRLIYYCFLWVNWIPKYWHSQLFAGAASSSSQKLRKKKYVKVSTQFLTWVVVSLFSCAQCWALTECPGGARWAFHWAVLSSPLWSFGSSCVLVSGRKSRVSVALKRSFTAIETESGLRLSVSARFFVAWNTTVFCLHKKEEGNV